MKPTGSVTVTGTAEQLKAMGIPIGADGQFSGRGRITAVKRSVCLACGGCYGKSPDLSKVRECDCPNGGTFRETDLGVLSDSGPKGFRRPFWLLNQAIKKRFA